MDNEYIPIYAIIPSYIYKSKDLSCEDKLIAERLTALCKKEGYAWITNKSLADMYGIREDSISRNIRNLRKIGFIKCIYAKEVPDKSKRVIYLADNIWAHTPITTRQNGQEQIGSQVGHNNNMNNKINNNMNIEDSQSPMSFDKDGTMLWHGKRCETTPCSKEEQTEIDKLFEKFQGDNNE